MHERQVGKTNVYSVHTETRKPGWILKHGDFPWGSSCVENLPNAEFSISTSGELKCQLRFSHEVFSFALMHIIVYYVPCAWVSGLLELILSILCLSGICPANISLPYFNWKTVSSFVDFIILSYIGQVIHTSNIPCNVWGTLLNVYIYTYNVSIIW